MSDNSIPEISAADYGRIGAAVIAASNDDRSGFDLAMADAQRAKRSLEFVAGMASMLARACGMYDDPDAVAEFRRRLAQLTGLEIADDETEEGGD